jgi:hypothetical protein
LKLYGRVSSATGRKTFFSNKGRKYLSLKNHVELQVQVYKERAWKISSIYSYKAALVLEEASEIFINFAEHHFTLRASC